MRVLVGILLFTTIVHVGLGQELSPESDATIRIHTLVIEADGLPNRDREQITHRLIHRAYPQGELEDRIEIAFRELGYVHARVDKPKLSFIGETQGEKDVNVSARVDEGVQYRLGEIRFEKASLFPPDRMRKLFRVQTGDLFNVTKMAEGLEQLRNLYATEGYVDFVANPVDMEKSYGAIDLVIEIDEGKPYDFGQLALDGVEAYAGVGKALMESWKTLQGRRYSPLLLKRWLAANSPERPGRGSASSDRIVTAEDPGFRVVNVKLLLP